MHKGGEKNGKPLRKRRSLAAKKSFLRPPDVKCVDLAATLMTVSAARQLKLTVHELLAHLNTYLESKQSFSKDIRTKSLTFSHSNCCNYDVLIRAEADVTCRRFQRLSDWIDVDFLSGMHVFQLAGSHRKVGAAGYYLC